MLKKLLRRLASKPYFPRRKNGQFKAHNEIPIQYRDFEAFKAWVYKTKRIKFKNDFVAMYHFNKERKNYGR